MVSEVAVGAPRDLHGIMQAAARVRRLVVAVQRCRAQQTWSELVLTWWAKILTLLPKQRSGEKPRPRLDEDERAAGDLRAWEEPCVGGSLSTYGERVHQQHTAHTGQLYTDSLCAVRAVGVHANCHVSRHASVWAPPGPCVAAESMVCLCGGWSAAFALRN